MDPWEEVELPEETLAAVAAEAKEMEAVDLDLEGGWPYWVSIGNSRGVRRLHRVGGCHLVPGVSVRHWEPLHVLTEECADVRCRLCWAEDRLVGQNEAAALEEDEIESSGSSSSDIDAKSPPLSAPGLDGLEES